MTWAAIAHHIVQGLGTQPGELVQIRDNAGRVDVLSEIALAVELAGATPLVQLLAPEQMQRLWDGAPRDYLAHWDRHRDKWAAQTDRYVTLVGQDPAPGTASKGGFLAWRQAVHRLTVMEEARLLPALLVAIPTEGRARQLGMSLEALEAILVPALGASVQKLQAEIDRVLAAVEGGRTISIRSGDDHELRLDHGDRPWLYDDGLIDEADRVRGAIVGNLPAGSVYTTVLEGATEGSLWLSQAGDATEVVLYLNAGRIERIEAAAGAEGLRAMFDSHSGEPRRVSHVGLGLNPYLSQPIGWALVDEQARGCPLICFGENRYIGGENASSLNVDFALPGATLTVDGRTIVSGGDLVC